MIWDLRCLRCHKISFSQVSKSHIWDGHFKILVYYPANQTASQLVPGLSRNCQTVKPANVSIPLPLLWQIWRKLTMMHEISLVIVNDLLMPITKSWIYCLPFWLMINLLTWLMYQMKVIRWITWYLDILVKEKYITHLRMWWWGAVALVPCPSGWLIYAPVNGPNNSDWMCLVQVMTHSP